MEPVSLTSVFGLYVGVPRPAAGPPWARAAVASAAKMTAMKRLLSFLHLDSSMIVNDEVVRPIGRSSSRRVRR
jgi:hypothetical protein